LSDWWRAREREERRRQSAAVSWRFAGGLAAAGLLVGAVFGGLGGRWAFGGDSVPPCKYTEGQRAAMMEVLVASGELRQTAFVKHRTELAACAVCHSVLRTQADRRSAQVLPSNAHADRVTCATCHRAAEPAALFAFAPLGGSL
jgi:hypothetical protein